MKCPICGEEYEINSRYCQNCGTKLLDNDLIRENLAKGGEQSGFLIKFLDKNSNLFTILATIAALITIVPIFINFVLGESWVDIIFSSPLGFYILILFFIASYVSVFFVISMLTIVFLQFLDYIMPRENLPIYYKILLIFLLFACLCAIVSIFIILIFIWYVKLDPLISVINLYLFLLLTIGIAIIFAICFYMELYKLANKKSIKFIISVMVVVLIIGFLWSVITIGCNFSGLSEDFSVYLSKKSINVDIGYDKIEQPFGTPVILSLSDNCDLYLTKNFGYFDRYFARYQWSTNYGYFTIVSLDNSIIETGYQDFEIPVSQSSNKRIYWTYDIEDYGKDKPQVLIGLSIEEPNKNVNNHLGSAFLSINWTGSDCMEINNDTRQIISVL